MPLLFPKTYAEYSKRLRPRIIHSGQRATAYRLWGIADPKRKIKARNNELNGKVARIGSLEPKRGQQPEKIMFWQFKVAHALYPKNFPNIGYARVAHPNDIHFGGVLISDYVQLDNRSQRVLRNARDLLDPDPKVNEFFLSRTWKNHERRVEKEAEPLAEEMKKQGIAVNYNPHNVFFDIEGNPVFFDIMTIDTLLLSEELLQDKSERAAKALSNCSNLGRVRMEYVKHLNRKG
ncbi:MAG TPA: hypothetical protein HA254_07410 [Candidatus Diapherotrites archaeon]|uniref:Uncharacterized protein n=1 Tax=Candidatus Iainarchaeum sp. TaxID=3101447 RepID=A0A7J4IZY2_9ARCH|nr:hypothetical protein [Candidatus Diapherotrites archaeon]